MALTFLITSHTTTVEAQSAMATKDLSEINALKNLQIKEPVIPNHSVKLTDFGAVSGG